MSTYYRLMDTFVSLSRWTLHVLMKRPHPVMYQKVACAFISRGD